MNTGTFRDWYAEIQIPAPGRHPIEAAVDERLAQRSDVGDWIDMIDLQRGLDELVTGTAYDALVALETAKEARGRALAIESYNEGVEAGMKRSLVDEVLDRPDLAQIAPQVIEVLAVALSQLVQRLRRL